MASNFPSSLDTFTNPSSTDAMDSVSVPHATQHSDLNDAVEALQAKVGADSSGVVSSHDYKIAQLEAISHGKILQVVSTTKTDHFTTTGTGVDITGMSVTLTPSSIDSKVLILVMLSLGSQTTTGATIYLNRGGTDIAVGTAGATINSSLFARFAINNGNIGDHSIVHLDSPATTSATTYKLVMDTEPPGSTIYVNRRYQDANVCTVSSITALEVSA